MLDMSHWHKFDPVQKVTYLAQVATTLSFLAGSVFAFASWREARAAREDQKEFFASEKTPSLNISSILWLKAQKPGDDHNEDYLMFKVTNKGQSAANHVKFSLVSYNNYSADVKLEDLHPNLLGNDIVVQRDGEERLLIITKKNISNICRCEVTDENFTIVEDYRFYDTSLLLGIEIKYKDVIGNDRKTYYVIEQRKTKPSLPKPSVK